MQKSIVLLSWRTVIQFLKKKTCGAKGGAKSAIFGTIDLEPLYLHDNIVCAIFLENMLICDFFGIVETCFNFL